MHSRSSTWLFNRSFCALRGLRILAGAMRPGHGPRRRRRRARVPDTRPDGAGRLDGP
ncbi:MAG: hypothetical protein QOE17_246 [Gaiellales bacterium]|nr:hypothetical protein [Gaiellales bacterium]